MRPRPLLARVLAGLIAIGVGALLVGLSVAPAALPGDTFQVVPREAGPRAVVATAPIDPLWTLEADRPSPSVPVAVLTFALAVSIAVVRVRGRRVRPRWSSVAGPAEGARGPPRPTTG